ncbi:MAG: hypothetical protein V4673_09145 [Pseudomonadota bacterium]
MNSTIDRLSDSGTALVRQARRTFESTSSRMPDLPKWIEAGAALSVAKAGTKVATTLVRRNPGILLAVGVVGAGVLAYRAYRRHADARVDAPRAAISGKVTRSNGAKVKVTAADKKSEAKPGSTTKRTSRARKAAKQTDGADSSAE